MIKLFVGGFPLNYSELEIVQLLSPFGTVSTIKIVKDKVTKKCKGYAFVEVTDIAGADRMIAELNGFVIGDRVLKINKVDEEPPKPAYTKPSSKTVSKHGEPQKLKRPRKAWSLLL